MLLKSVVVLFMDFNISNVEFPGNGEIERLIKEDCTLLWRSTGFSSARRAAGWGRTSEEFRPSLGRNGRPWGTCCSQSVRGVNIGMDPVFKNKEDVGCWRMSTLLCLFASLLEHCQCFPCKDVFLIFSPGSVSRNTVSGAVFLNTLPMWQGVYGKHDLYRSYHSLPSLLQVIIKKYIWYWWENV